MTTDIIQAHRLHSPKEELKQFVTMTVAGQMFGISVFTVRDVLAPQKITPIPLSPPAVAGSLNLRGRIVTAIDIRVRLGLPSILESKKCMSVVVEHNEELYSLIVDSVGEVLSLPLSDFTHNPENLSPAWQDISSGIYPLKGSLLVILDVNRLLQFVSET